MFVSKIVKKVETENRVELFSSLTSSVGTCRVCTGFKFGDRRIVKRVGTSTLSMAIVGDSEFDFEYPGLEVESGVNDKKEI